MTKPIFVHIPKTAGSTLRTLITANYAPHEVLSLYGDDRKVLADATAHIGRTDPFQLIQGHAPYGIHRLLGLGGARYFTFMRDPVSRFMSDVAMGVRHPSHGFHHILAAPGLTREERIGKALELTYYRNNITQFLSGSFCTEAISMSLLNTAIDNLWSSEFIGLTEDFEASLLIMGRKLGWKKIIPQKSNVRPDPEPPLPPALHSMVERELGYDRCLYALAQEHLVRSKREYGSLLPEAAEQLGAVMKRQNAEHPDAQYGTYLVGQATVVPMGDYNAGVEKGSPLDRWMNH